MNNSTETKNCPNCGKVMIKKRDYLPDDYNLTTVKEFWLCTFCMFYEIIE